MTTDRYNLIEKIKKLRAVANDSGISEAEAEIFRGRANNMMQEHGITEDEILAAEAANRDGGDNDGKSRAKTFFVELEIDPITGTMVGRVLAGSFAGQLLSDLSIETIIDLLRKTDDDSRELLTAYLDWRFPGWASAIAAGPGQTSSPWTTPPHPNFPDVDKDGNPKRTFQNTRLALEHLPVKFAADLFHGTVLETRTGQKSQKFNDRSVVHWRDTILTTYGFDPGKGHVFDAIVTLAERSKFDPVLDWLNNLPAWDGKPRLDTWLTDCCHIEDTPLVREQGRLWLMAMVRRQYEPGTKFDYMPILEGSERLFKSTLCAILAGGEEYFSDQSILTRSDKEQQELLQGRLLYEVAELQGLSDTKLEKINAFITRRVDRNRLAWGRATTEAPRRCVLVGTTNQTRDYLKSNTARGRRFWPLAVPGKIDIGRVQRDRDQLFAEAKLRQDNGAPLYLSDELEDKAAAIVEVRREQDPFEDLINSIPEHLKVPGVNQRGQPVVRVRADALAEYVKIDYRNRSHTGRLGAAMRRAGWSGPENARVEGEKVLKKVPR
jgi:putative DNA primase/helicase